MIILKAEKSEINNLCWSSKITKAKTEIKSNIYIYKNNKKLLKHITK